MTLTLDAGVIVKWLIQDPDREPDTEKATEIVGHVVGGQASVLQPAHWLAEVAAVLARLSPASAAEDVERLAALEFPTTDEPEVLRRATQIAVDTGQHVFDTYYHAVALERDTTFITADQRYRTKAESYGRIVALEAWGTS